MDISRGRKSATIYTDGRQGLRAAVERAHPRLSATELAAMRKPGRWAQMKATLSRLRLTALVAAKIAAQELAWPIKQPELAHER